jgi:membrane protein DedA with SNARE-associated domain
MDSYVSQVISFIETHQAWAGPVIALLCFGESMILVGLFIPATALLILIGGLIGAGALPMATVLVWGVAGAIVGDAVSYYLGRWMGPGILRRGPLRSQRTAVARARLAFSRYGFMAVLVGRFLGPIRSTIPLVAGIMHMRQRLFQVANVLSAIVWVPVMLAPGYIGARTLGAADNANQVGMIVGSGLSVVVGVWLLVSMMKKRKRVVVVKPAPLDKP